MTVIPEGCPDDLEAAVAFLRSVGYSKIESIAAVAERFSLSLVQAKAAIHLSDTWADVRRRDDDFVDTVVTHLKLDG